VSKQVTVRRKKEPALRKAHKDGLLRERARRELGTRRNNAQPGDGLRAGLLQEVRKSLPPKQNCSTFLRNHASQIWACDFLQTYDILFPTLFVFVIIELGSRRVVHFSLTRHPTDQWIAQQLHNATPFGEGSRFLIRDNDRKYGASFDRVAAGN
jgi:hypothetical protein